MADPGTTLEARLTDLGKSLRYPPTPDLAPRVRAHIEAGRQVRRRPLRPRPALVAAVALVAVIVSVGSTLALSPAARRAVAGWLGLPGVRITTNGAGPTPSPGRASLHLGPRTSMARARAQVTWRVRVPGALGPPDQVHVADDVSGGRVTLLYRPRAGVPASGATGVGLLITELRARLDEELLHKTVSSGARLDILSVHGRTAFWITGGPHVVLYIGPAGDVIEDTLRVSDSALLWQEGGTTLRLEGAISKDRALEVARSMG